MVKASIIRLLGDRSGAATLEYALFAILIGIAAIAALDTLGSTVSNSMSNTNNGLVYATNSMKNN